MGPGQGQVSALWDEILAVNSRERLGWIALFIAFGIFCLLAVTIPLSIRWYIISATKAHRAKLEVIEGTILVETRTGLVPNRPLPEEGDSLRTDATSRGRITLFDGSSITLFPDTKVALQAMRTPRFSFSPRGNLLTMKISGGRTRIRVVSSENPSTIFRLLSPHGTAYLGEGDFSFKTNAENSELAVRQGSATFHTAGGSMSLSKGERVMARKGEPPSAPIPAARDLITNGDFSQPLHIGWEVYEDQGGDAGEIGGTAEVKALGDRYAVRFHRTGGQGNHFEIGIGQKIDEDISDSSLLVLRIDVQLRHQSLSGGGYQSSEYPVMVRIDYRDANKSPNFWIRGFYYWDDGTYPTLNGEKMPQGIWYPYENSQLLEGISPRPFYIDSIRVYASGWDYESLVSGVELITE